MTVYKQTMTEAYASMYEAKMSSSQLAKLKKAYDPMRGKKISTANADKLSKMLATFAKDKDTLIQLFKADIPFVSQGAVTQLITKHNMKGAQINKLKEMGIVSEDDPCWDNYKQVGMKMKDGKEVPNCVPEEVEKSLNEDNMDLMKKAAGGAMQHIKLKDGKLKMDSFTASAIMGVYDKVNPANKKKIETIINRGNKTSILKLQSMAMKAIKSGDELEHDGEELDEAKNYKIKNGKIHISKANFRKVHKDYKNSTKGKERMMALDPKSGATTSYEVVFEEVELDEKKIVLAKGMGKEVINDNGVIKLMKGGKVISDGDYDSGAGKFFMNIKGERGQVAFNEPEELLKIKEEVELDEAKYDLYHKDFSSAMQHATKMAKKLHGITIDPKEIDDKVATGPSKPGSGKTNKYRLKGDKGSIQVQVYNKGGSKPFELNMYQEEVELDEGTMHDVIVMKKGKVGVSVIANAANVKKMEKKGYKIDGVIEKGSKLLHKEPKRIMKAIKGGDKLNIGEGGMKRVASGHGLKTFKPKPPKPKKESVLDRIDKKLKERKNG